MEPRGKEAGVSWGRNRQERTGVMEHSLTAMSHIRSTSNNIELQLKKGTIKTETLRLEEVYICTMFKRCMIYCNFQTVVHL